MRGLISYVCVVCALLFVKCGNAASTTAPVGTTPRPAPVLAGYVPIYVGTSMLPSGYVPVYRAVADDVQSGFVQFTAVGGMPVFSLLYGTNSFAITAVASGAPVMYGSGNVPVTPQFLPVYGQALPPGMVPSSPPAAYLPVYAYGSGVTLTKAMPGVSGGSVNVYASLNPPLLPNAVTQPPRTTSIAVSTKPETTSVIGTTPSPAPVLVGFAPIYAVSGMVPTGFVPVYRMVANDVQSGYVQFTTSSGFPAYSPLYGTGSFVVTAASSGAPVMYGQGNVQVTPQYLPIYGQPGVPGMVPASPPVAYLPVYSYGSGVTLTKNIAGATGGYVSVYASLNPPLLPNAVTQPPRTTSIAVSTSLKVSDSTVPVRTTPSPSSSIAGYVPIYDPYSPFPRGYLPVTRAASGANVSSYAQFYLSNGVFMFAPMYSSGAFAVVNLTSSIPLMYDAADRLVGSSVLPVYSQPLPPNSLPGGAVIAYLPVYAASNGVTNVMDLFGSQGAISVFSSVNPMFSLVRKGILSSMPVPTLPYSSRSTQLFGSPAVSTPRPSVPVTFPSVMSSTPPLMSGMFIVVTPDGFFKLASTQPTGTPFTTIFAFANNQPVGIPVYRQ